MRFAKPTGSGNMWRRAWVNAVHCLAKRFPEPLRLLHMEGLGQISIGSRDWRDYPVQARLTPYLAKQAGVAARWQCSSLRAQLGAVHLEATDPEAALEAGASLC